MKRKANHPVTVPLTCKSIHFEAIGVTLPTEEVLVALHHHRELLAALLALRAEAQPYEDDEGLDKAKRRADRAIRRAMMATLKRTDRQLTETST